MDVPTINRDALKRKIDQRERFVLVEVLSPEGYAKGHLPGAINLPWDHEPARSTSPGSWRRWAIRGWSTMPAASRIGSTPATRSSEPRAGTGGPRHFVET
jgi:hypothetical protein